MPAGPKQARIARCPKCNAAIPWSMDNPYRPFCSKRCKLIDLGQWATGAYRVPEQEPNSGSDEDKEI